jgi:hypothetical protein
MQQSNDNVPKTGTLVCRKCGGAHLTIKCGKDKPAPVAVKKQTYYELKAANTKEPSEESKPANYTEFVERDNVKRHHFKKTYRVKISNLPNDITEEEMMELTCDWGHVNRIKVLTYEDASIVYIDFGYMDEATYFIEALDKTPFEYLILSVVMVDSD